MAKNALPANSSPLSKAVHSPSIELDSHGLTNDIKSYNHQAVIRQDDADSLFVVAVECRDKNTDVKPSKKLKTTTALSSNSPPSSMSLASSSPSNSNGHSSSGGGASGGGGICSVLLEVIEKLRDAESSPQPTSNTATSASKKTSALLRNHKKTSSQLINSILKGVDNSKSDASTESRQLANDVGVKKQRKKRTSKKLNQLIAMNCVSTSMGTYKIYLFFQLLRLPK